jgi:predicted PurR-regulated permease PerM
MKRLALITATIVATLLGVGLAWQLRGVILIFFASLATAAALRPVATWLAGHGLRWGAALAISYLAAAASLALLVSTSLTGVASDIDRLSVDFGHAYERVIQDWPSGSPLQQTLARYLPKGDEIEGPLGGMFIERIKNWLLGLTLGFVETIINIVLVVVLSVYWSFDRVAFERLWLSILPVERRGPARDIWREIEQESGAYLRSEIIQCAAAGLLLNAGFVLLGHPYPALLALIGALAWVIPWIGGLLAVAAVFVFSMAASMTPGGPSLMAAAVPASVYTMAVLSFLEFVVEPRLFDRRRYNAILMVVLLVGLTEWLGLLGMLLGPPLAAALQILGGHVLEQRQQAVTDATSAPASLQTRLERIRATLANTEQSRPELASLLDRLSELLEQAKQVPATRATTAS